MQPVSLTFTAPLEKNLAIELFQLNTLRSRQPGRSVNANRIGCCNLLQPISYLLCLQVDSISSNSHRENDQRHWLCTPPAIQTPWGMDGSGRDPASPCCCWWLFFLGLPWLITPNRKMLVGPSCLPFFLTKSPLPALSFLLLLCRFASREFTHSTEESLYGWCPSVAMVGFLWLRGLEKPTGDPSTNCWGQRKQA